MAYTPAMHAAMSRGRPAPATSWAGRARAWPRWSGSACRCRAGSRCRRRPATGCCAGPPGPGGCPRPLPGRAARTRRLRAGRRARSCSAVRAAGLAPEDAARLRDDLARVLPGDEPLAVRSSAVAEDGGADSFAGQLESFLAVPRAGVEARVLDTIASAHGARALLYRRVRGLPSGGVRTAVVVQRLVDARRAGVLFTANPTTGDTAEAVVVAGLGLGEGVVAGRVETDTWYAELATGRVRRHVPARKATRSYPRPAAARASRRCRRPRPPRRRSPRRRWRRWWRRAGGLRRRPGCRRTWSGPSTGPARSRCCRPGPITALARGREHVFDDANIVEGYPGLTSPLTFSVVRAGYQVAFREAARAFGVPEAVLEAERAVFSHLVALVDGRVVYDLLGWYRLYQLVPGFEGLLAGFEKGLGIPRRFVAPAPPARGLDRLRRAAAQARVVLRMGAALARAPALGARVPGQPGGGAGPARRAPARRGSTPTRSSRRWRGWPSGWRAPTPSPR